MADKNKINILNDDIIGKIAAGEVVERPSSVVKELVENSIDAGADSIEVEIQAAGQTLIRVADNGEGMNRKDAEMACKRHATSKLKDIKGLDSINTLGFRGEALSSIAAVSRMDLITCNESGKSGVHICVESGEILKLKPAGRTKGTTVEVRNLFYNVPARRKFLKKESTELSEIVNIVGRFVLAYSDVEFKLTQSGRCLIHAASGMDMTDRIRLVLGGDAADNMVRMSDSDDKNSITGHISRPANTRKDRRSQIFFINGRFVKNKLLNDAVYGAYRSLLERGRYPSVILFLDIDPQNIDVNVHPAKLEVKFDDEKSIKDIVIKTIRETFEDIKQTDPVFKRESSFSPAAISDSLGNDVLSGVSEVQTEFPYDVKDNISKSKRQVAFVGAQETISPGKKNIFQVGKCYIVRATTDGVVIVDQHAAHERILYEFFSRILEEKGQPEIQNLLFPVRVDLASSEAVTMEKILDRFKVLGFHIELFGDKSYIIQAVPAILKERDIKTVIYDILTDIASHNLTRGDLSEELVKLTSCRAAIKSGDTLSEEEMILLLKQLDKCELPFTCPHGRPTTLKINIDELEKRFHRK